MFQHRGALDHVLKPSSYGDPGFHARERRAIFARAWHYAGPRASLATDGAWLARDVHDVPVVLWNAEGRLRAFRNVCAHRHSQVAATGCGRAERLRCPYHGWEYDASGRVARIPDGASFRGLRDPGGLAPLAVETLGGMAFVNLDPEAESLRESLGPFADEIERHFGRHRLVWTWVTEHDVDWKVIAENAVESYHVPTTHPATFQDYRPSEWHDHRLEKRYTRYQDRKPWSGRWVDRGLQLAARALLPDGAASRFTQAHVFPGHLFYYNELFSTFVALEPLGPTRTRHVQLGFVPRGLRAAPWARPLQALFWRAMVLGVRRVMREDMRIWRGVQRGLSASPHAGVLSCREERVHAFQAWVAEAVRAAPEGGRDV
jgi:phenylpropionate dioxygenase-like ring-hydroxylating dioxygenase large terminal subunit